MSSNTFSQTRELFRSAVSTLPADYLQGNAAALLSIAEELNRSYRLELRIIQAIKGLNLNDQIAVKQLATDFQNYHQSRDFDKERTHCRNISRIARTILVPLKAGGNQADDARVKQLEDLIMMLGAADYEFMDEIEEVMDRALIAVSRINTLVEESLKDPDQLAAARQEQQTFTDQFEGEFFRLKTVLKKMNILANDLIDIL